MLHRKAKNYLEDCMASHKKQNEWQEMPDNAVEQIIGQETVASSDSFLDAIKTCLQPRKHSELLANFSRFMQSVFKDGDTEQAIVDFIY